MHGYKARNLRMEIAKNSTRSRFELSSGRTDLFISLPLRDMSPGCCPAPVWLQLAMTLQTSSGFPRKNQ
jgi:hypothetical protein